MKNLTYKEAITHVRKYRDVYKMEAIAKLININADQFRHVIKQIHRSNELPEKYRERFIEVVTELTCVRQEVPNDLEDEQVVFSEMNELV